MVLLWGLIQGRQSSLQAWGNLDQCLMSSRTQSGRGHREICDLFRVFYTVTKDRTRVPTHCLPQKLYTSPCELSFKRLTKEAVFHTDSDWNDSRKKRPGRHMAKKLRESRVQFRNKKRSAIFVYLCKQWWWVNSAYFSSNLSNGFEEER